MADYNLRAGTFNLRHARFEDPEPRDWNTRLPVAARHVIASGVSIVGLQEAGFPDDYERSQARQLVQEINRQTDSTAWRVIYPSLEGITLAVIYDSTRITPHTDELKVRKINEVHVEDTGKWMVYGTFATLQGDPFIFANTEFQASDPEAVNADARRIEEAEIASQVLNDEKGNLPVIFVGCFNTGSFASGTPRRIITLAGFPESASVANRINGGFNSFNDFDPYLVGKQTGNWIDGVHVSLDIRVNFAALYVEFESGASLPLDTPLPSDHSLMYADLQVPVPASSAPAIEFAPTTTEFVYPRRNLGSGENWGRVLQRRLEDAARYYVMQSQGSSGLNRATAASLSDIASSAAKVNESAEQVRNAILQFPKFFAESQYESGFAVGSSWTTVASVSLPRPAGMTRLEVMAEARTQVYNPEAVAEDAFEWPFDLRYVTSEFGPREPLPYHNGIDFSYGGIYNDPIPAAADGEIMLCNYFDDWGNYVRIRHSPRNGNTLWTGYAHMIRLPNWKVGDKISQGDTVGRVGTTGLSTGPHLHFETAENGVRINPRTFFNRYGNAPVFNSVNTQCRILIDGESLQTFSPLNPSGDFEIHHAIGGSSIDEVSSNVVVRVQLRGRVPARSSNRATLTVTGSFLP